MTVNPLELVTLLSTMSKAIKIAEHMKNLDAADAEGNPVKDGHPDYIQLLEATQKFVNDIGTLNKDAERIVKLESVLVTGFKSEIKKKD